MVVVREASPVEVGAHNANPKILTWGVVAEDRGKIIGSVYLSKALGSVFGHDAFCDSDDPQIAARMYLRARKKCREWGAHSLVVHVVPDSEGIAFWMSVGFKPIGILLEGKAW